MSGTNNKQPLLSICIPTWNRSRILSISLESLVSEIASINKADVEIFVSDNCSDDETSCVVQKYIEQGLPITYNRNEQNLGAARNFIKCMQWASGKYIWLIGDDDMLRPGALKTIINVLKNDNYGLIHIKNVADSNHNVVVFNNIEQFFKAISFNITFMSASIFLKEIVENVDSDKYVNTHLLQVPYYIHSALNGTKNCILSAKLLEDGLDASSNGGYNYYDVFVTNYLSIWKEFVINNLLASSVFLYLKKDIYTKFISEYNYSLLIKRQNIKPENFSYIRNRKGFKIKGAWRILFHNYGGCSYFYFSLLSYVYRIIRGCVKRIFIMNK